MLATRYQQKANFILALRRRAAFRLDKSEYLNQDVRFTTIQARTSFWLFTELLAALQNKKK